MESETISVSELEEFEFRLRLEQEQPVPPARMPTTEMARESGFMKGLFDPAAGIGQLTEQIAPTTLPPEAVLAGVEPKPLTKQAQVEEAIYQQRRKERGEEGFDWPRMGGAVVSPATLPLMAAPMGQATLPARMKAAAGVGAVGAGTQPVTEGDFWTEKAKQVGTGAAIGPLFPAAGTAAKAGWTAGGQFFRPLSEKGIKTDVQDFLVNIVGADRDKVILALNTAKEGETAQQVLGRSVREAKARGETDIFGTKIAKLEDELEKSALTGDTISAIKARQATAREEEIGRIAKTPEDLKAAEALRETAATKAYAEAFKEPVEIKKVANLYRLAGMDTPSKDVAKNYTKKIEKTFEDPYKFPIGKTTEDISVQRTVPIRGVKSIQDVVKGDPKLKSIFSDPYARSVLPIAEKLGQAKGFSLEKNPVQYMHSIKKGLDNLLDKTSDAKVSQGEFGAVNSVRKNVINWLEDNSKLYEKARSDFAEASSDIDKMKVGKILQDALTKSEKEAPRAFLKAAEEAPKTLKKATGFPRHEQLSDVLEPKQVESVRKVTDELLNIQQGKELAKKKTGLLGKIEGEVEPQLPHILSRPVVIMNAILKTVGKDKTPQYQAVLEDVVTNPKKLADYLTLPPTNPQRKIAMDVMKKLSTISTTQEMGREVGQ
jgi:hypothetical protein